MNCSDWMGPSGPSMDCNDSVEELDDVPSAQSITPIKTIQGESSSWTGCETGKAVGGNGGLDSYEVIFVKDNVSVHPARYARERINGRLRLTKRGPSLFMTWTPPFDVGRRGSTDMRTAEKDKSWYMIRAVSLAEMRSIRRYTPSGGLQYIIIVLTSGLSLPPLYFHTGGVKEFFATLRNHALLVRSIDDPSVYFVTNVHVEEETKDTTEREREAKEIKIEQSFEPELEKETENKGNRGQVADSKPGGWPDMVADNPPSSMDHTVGLDTPPCRRYRRGAKDLPTLPPPKEDIVLKSTTSFYPIQRKEETEKKITEEETGNKDGLALVLGRAQSPPLGQEERATLFDNEVQGVGAKPVRWPVIAGNLSPSCVEHAVGLDTPPRKRYRRCKKDLPDLPAPREDIELEFTKSLYPIRGRNRRKTVDLVLPLVAGALTPVYSRKRKTVDLVLCPITAESTHADLAPTSPHTTPIVVGFSNGSFASPVVELEGSPQPRTVVEEKPSAGAPDEALSRSPLSGLSDDAASSHACERAGHFFRLFCSGGFREGVALPLSWRNRLHLAELTSEECALARRRREWWLGSCLSASVTTGIPSHVICLLFTSELFTRLMVDSSLTYKALNALMHNDKLGVLKHVTSGDICQYLKTLFSKAVRNRLRWQRMGVVISGGVVDKGDGLRPVVQPQTFNEQPLATSLILPLQQRSGAPQQNDHRERPARRWVQRSAREALREVFEEWGCRQVTLDETVALAARFQDNPDAMQIMQLFRNWAQHKRRTARSADSSSSHAQPTAENAVLAREVLRQVFEYRGCREITPDEAIALAVRFWDSNPTHIQLQFSNWAQEKRRRDQQDAKNCPEQLVNEQLITCRQALQRTRLAEARQREDAQQPYQLLRKPSGLIPVCGLQSESQPTGMRDSPGPSEMSRRRARGGPH